MTENKLIKLFEKNDRRVVLFFFIAFFLTGVFIFKDFGMSWDERYQWKGNGQTNWNYVFHGNEQALLLSDDKYHGPAFELVLVAIERMLGLEDVRSVFLMRHFMCFFLFFVSSVFFYRLGQRIFKSRSAALLGVLMYVSSPHIFSHAFYNSKDTVFLSLFVISIYCLFRFLEQRNVWSILLFAAITAFMIDVRIIGILVPLFFVYLLSFEKGIITEKLKWIGLFFAILVPIIILFWPVLWIDPLFHFKEALKENSNFPWDAPVLYFGKEYRPTTLPWHYVYFWMFISRPLIYSLFFVAGVVFAMKQLISTPQRFIKQEKPLQVILLWFFLPLSAMFILKSPAFDTGRHLYFLHGAFVLLSVHGAQQLWRSVSGKRVLAYTYAAALVLSLAFLLFNMIRLHPYEHVYFNETKMQSKQEQKNNFEFDYWGLSAKYALENILKIDTSKQINIQAENLPGEINAWLLKPEERARLRYTKNLEGAKYFLADYRWRKEEDYQFKKEVYSTTIGNTRASTIFKVKSTSEVYQSGGRTIQMFKNDFETAKPEWKGNNIIKPDSAHSGIHCTEVDQKKSFSESLEIKNVRAFVGNRRLMVKTVFWMYDVEPGSSSKLVISFEDKEGHAYFWYGIAEMKNEYSQRYPRWKKVYSAMELPAVRCESDKISVYLMNTGKKRILLDDVEIRFEEQLTE